MAQYINKSALVAEIENLKNTYKKCPTRNSYEEGLKDGRLIGYEDTLHKIEVIEVKEVDLNKEISQFIDANFEKATIGHKLSLRRTAKHFFELGLKARKENKV